MVTRYQTPTGNVAVVSCCLHLLQLHLRLWLLLLVLAHAGKLGLEELDPGDVCLHLAGLGRHERRDVGRGRAADC